jgi:hypothetical protein
MYGLAGAALPTDRVIEVVCFKNSCAAAAAFLGRADKGLTSPGRLTYLAVQLQTISKRAIPGQGEAP